MTYKLLLVEDNEIVAQATSEALKRQGFKVDSASDAESADTLINHTQYDMILLDLMLPGIDGSDFLRELRKISDLPIIITSAKDGEVDKAVNLELGADDYITKPISTIELVARIKAVLRRAQGNKKTMKVLWHQDVKINTEAHEVYKSNEIVPLTAKEYDILKLFFENPNNVFTKRQIYTQVWHDDYYIDENIINVHIRRLRKKIETHPSSPTLIVTVWGVGYKLGKK